MCPAVVSTKSLLLSGGFFFCIRIVSWACIPQVDNALQVQEFAIFILKWFWENSKSRT